MAVDKIHLHKLLKLIYSTERKVLADLKSDLRMIRKKEAGLSGGGGDFYSPFWFDVKAYLMGSTGLELSDFVKERIEKNPISRQRLYPDLLKGFSTWWEEKRRWQNEPFTLLPEPIIAQHIIPELNAIIKIENILYFEVGEKFKRLIYPYFSEAPILSDEAARIGLWVLTQALDSYPPNEIRILDIFRGQAFSVEQFPFEGNEQEILHLKYDELLRKWRSMVD